MDKGQGRNILIAIAMLLVFLLTGCGGPGVASKQIVVGENVDLGGYDPATDMSPFSRLLIYNSLVELDANFQLTPGLAERWEMSPDGKRWTFFLRKGVVFHDGTPLTAEIVKNNMDRLRTGSQKVWLAEVKEVLAEGDGVVRFIMNSPAFTFASDMTVPFLSIVSPTALDAQGKVVKAIGTGPFRLDKWQKDQEYVLQKNVSYWGGAPKVDRLVFKVIRDPDARAMALDAGTVDFASLRQSLTAAEQLAKNNKLKLEKRLGQTSEILFFNVDSPALANLRIRQAVAHAMDIKGMIPALLGINAEPGKTFFSPAYGNFVMPQESFPQYDPAKAKALLAETGNALQLRLVFGAKNAEDSLLAGAIQSQLKAVGIAVTLVPMEDAALMDSLKKKNYDMIMLGQSFIPHNEPASCYRRWYFHPQSTYNVLRTAEVTQAIDQLFATADPAARIAQHHKIQQLISAQAPMIVLFHRNNIVAMKKNIVGFEVSVGTWQLYRGLAKADVQ